MPLALCMNRENKMPISMDSMLDGNDFLLNAVADNSGICNGHRSSVFNNVINNSVNMEVAAIIVNRSFDFTPDCDSGIFFHLDIADNNPIDVNKSISVDKNVIFDHLVVTEIEGRAIMNNFHS